MRFLKNTLTCWFVSMCLIIAASAVYMLKANEIYYRNVEKTNTDIQEMVLGTQPVEGTKLLDLINIRSLQSKIPGIVGWIYQEGTGINYPIMYRENDNEFYLKHDPYGKPSTSGSIFMDGRNTPDFSDENTVIYGHNMKNGSMFGLLKRYVTDQSYYQEHPTFWIVTTEGYKEYNVIGAYTESYKGNEFTVSFNDAGSYESFLNQTKAKSLYNTGIEYDTKKNVITLASCYSSGTAGIKTIVVLQEKS